MGMVGSSASPNEEKSLESDREKFGWADGKPFYAFYPFRGQPVVKEKNTLTYFKELYNIVKNSIAYDKGDKTKSLLPEIREELGELVDHVKRSL
jgi:hypothetical protein